MVAGSGKGTIDLPINAVLPFVVRGRLFSCNFLGSLESVVGGGGVMCGKHSEHVA